MSDIEDIGSYDAIVIGSGMSGLMAGNALVKKGYRVLMLEKHAIPGGYTTNFERKGFRFDASTHVINGCGPRGIAYRQLEKIDAQDRVEFIKVDNFGRVVDEARGTEFVMPWELGQYVEMLASQFPHEESGIRGYYGKFGPMAETLIASIGAEKDAEPPGDIAAAAQEYAALQGKKASQVLNEYVSDPRLIELITAIPSGFTGTPYRELEASTCIMCDLFYRVDGGDAYYPKGGSGHMSAVVADLFQERGGTLLFRRGVTEIAFAGGRAAGVIAEKPRGGSISAQGRCVIAASDLTALVNELCPEGSLPEDYVKSVNERVPGISSVTLFAGLDIDLRKHGITECEISRSWAEGKSPSAFGEAARSGDYTKLPNADATIYSNLDPSCCPEGKSVVASMVLARPELFERALDPGRKRGKAYKELKKGLTSQLLQRMSRALGIADLERHVEVLELATPITLERYTSNRAGAYVGWKYSTNQAQDHFSQKSPVENLFLCGHWVSPGGGVSNVMRGGNIVAEIADGYLRSPE
ncbi:MAG: NAD(P)/FAD-dependent oxidoreductase [Deltaproteobacteria bacterium]|nr:NAD(P)/FAD-dependent oxidoreductase [Deltaproteobacteria bacterium]